MSSQFKVITQNNAGTSTMFGGDDLDKTHILLNGGVGYSPITLRSPFGVEDGKFFIEYPTTGKRLYIRTGALETDQDWLLPVGTGWVTNNIKNIFANEQVFEKFVNFKKISPPANPDANYLTIWADSATGQIMVKDSSGLAQAIFADIAAVANAGTTGVSVYDGKTGSTVYLRSITSLNSALTVTHNDTNNSIDLDLAPAQISFEDIGGTLLSSQVPVLGTGNLPAAVVLDTESSTFSQIMKHDKHQELKLQDSHPTPSSGYVSFYPYSDGKLYFKNSSGTRMNLLYDTDLNNTCPLPPFGYISGHWDATHEDGTGLLNNMTSVADIAVTEYHNLTTGQYAMEWGVDQLSTAVGLSTTRGRSSDANLCYRDANPTLTVRFQVDLSANPTNSRAFIGLTSACQDSAFDATNTPLNNYHGVMLCKRTSDTAWQFARNDGAATQTVDNTGGLPSVDTGVHTLKIIGDNDNDRWGMSWDGGTVTWKTDNDPIEERKLGFAAYVSEATTVSAIKLRLYDITIWRRII